MMKTQRNPSTIHAPLGPYSHQIELGGPMRWLVLSGQVGQREDGSVPGGFVQQLEVALENIGRNLETAGMETRDLVKLVFFVVGETKAEKYREVFSAWFEGHQPCMTLVRVVGLAAPAYKIEVDAWACRPEDRNLEIAETS